MKRATVTNGVKQILLACLVGLFVAPTVVLACFYASTADGWSERIEPGGFYVTCDNVPVCTYTEDNTHCVNGATIQITCTRDDGSGSYTMDAYQTSTEPGCNG